jgi:glycosyltransferase involved in cell wall biosynthesis
MLEQYRWADLLVLPSICDGFGLVVYEALACGIPIIATRNTGAWIRDRIDGLVVPIRDVEALSRALERFVTDAEFLRFCRHNVQMNRDRVGLDAYQRRLVQTVREVMKRN